MQKTKQDKYDLLVSVIDAIYDENKKVVVETVNNGSYDDEPAIPKAGGKTKFLGPYSENASYAQSIKIGKILIQRIPVKKSRAREKKNNGQIFDYSCTYIVRTPNGEAEFLDTDRDFIQVWHAALRKYDISNGTARGANQNMSDIKSFLYRQVKHNPKLAEAAARDIQQKDTKSKYESAIEKLKEMGIQPRRLAKYIQDKQND